MKGPTQYAILALVLAPVLYVLSAGPVVGYYIQRNTMAPSPVIAFYTPLGWCCDNFPAFGWLFDEYVRLCAPNA